MGLLSPTVSTKVRWFQTHSPIAHAQPSESDSRTRQSTIVSNGTPWSDDVKRLRPSIIMNMIIKGIYIIFVINDGKGIYSLGEQLFYLENYFV